MVEFNAHAFVCILLLFWGVYSVKELGIGIPAWKLVSVLIRNTPLTGELSSLPPVHAYQLQASDLFAPVPEFDFANTLTRFGDCPSRPESLKTEAGDC